MELRWYLVQCKPWEDERALAHLEQQGFECFRALRRAERRSPSGRKYFAMKALFPGYVFTRLDRIHDNWAAIRSTRGVSRIVRFDEYPWAVPDEIIEGLRARLAAIGTAKSYLQPGERVQITEGAFAKSQVAKMESLRMPF